MSGKRKIEIIDGITYVNGKRQGRAPKVTPAAAIADRDPKPPNVIARETSPEPELVDDRELPADEPSPNYFAADLARHPVIDAVTDADGCVAATVTEAAAIAAFIAEAEGPSSVTPDELRTLELHAPFELADCAELRDAIKAGHPAGTLVEVCIPTADTVRVETRVDGLTVQRNIALRPRTA